MRIGLGLALCMLVTPALAQEKCDTWLKRFFTIECARDGHHDTRDRVPRGSDAPDVPDDDGGGVTTPDPPTPNEPTPPTPGPDEPTPPTTPGTGDANKGHGNDTGHHDRDNPGKGRGNHGTKNR